MTCRGGRGEGGKKDGEREGGKQGGGDRVKARSQSVVVTSLGSRLRKSPSFESTGGRWGVIQPDSA